MPGISLRAQPKSLVTLNKIATIVCDYFEVDDESFYGKHRKRTVVEARFFFMHYAKNKGKYTLADIGRCINRDHTTVMHGITTLDNLIYTDKRYEKEVKNLEIHVNLMLI